MKLLNLALALSGLTVASAQTACSAAVSAVPTCGEACITSVASALGCGPTDFACQCAPSASSAIVNSALGCVVGACGIQTALIVSSAANAVCTACASASA